MLGICLFPDNGWALSGNVGVSTGQSCGGRGLTARHYGWEFSSTQIWLWPFYFPLSKCNLKFHLSCTISIQALNWCFSVMFTPPPTQTVPCQFSGLKKKKRKTGKMENLCGKDWKPASPIFQASFQDAPRVLPTNSWTSYCVLQSYLVPQTWSFFWRNQSMWVGRLISITISPQSGIWPGSYPSRTLKILVSR